MQRTVGKRPRSLGGEALQTKLPKPGRSDLRGFGGLSDRKLHELLTTIQRCPAHAEEVMSRKAIGRADERGFQHCFFVAGSKTHEGEDVFLDFTNPLLVMKLFCEEDSGFCNMVSSMVDGRPHDHVYAGITYWDEATPGALLRLDNQRSFYVIFFALREFGAALHRESCWIPVGIIRSTLIKTIRGGRGSAMLASFMRVLIPLFQLGITLSLPTVGPILLRTNFDSVIADEPALASGYDGKTAGGTVPCLICGNMVYQRAAGRMTDDSYVVDITCTCKARFDMRTDEDFYNIVDELEARKTTVGIMHEYEIVVGVKHNPDGMLATVPRTCFKPRL